MQPKLGYLSQNAGGSSSYLSAPQPAAQAAKGNSWLSHVPSGLAALASFVPGVGTLAAGGLGAIGEAARQNLAGENFNLGKILGEGALSAVPFGLGKVAKAVKGGVQTAKAINVTRKGLQAAGTVEKAAPVAAEAATAAPSLLSKISTGMEGNARGINPGVTAVGQDQLGVQGAGELNQFLNNVGVRGTNAAGQLSKLEKLHGGWGKQLEGIIKEGNAPLPATSISTVKDGIAARLSEIAGLPKSSGETGLVDAAGNALITTGKDLATHPYITDLYGDLGKVHDLQGLNKLRQRIDDTINYGRKSATPDPQKEQIAQAFRRGINDFVGNALPEAKDVAGLMSKSYDAQDFLKNAAKNPKGWGRVFGFPLVPGSVAQDLTAKAGQLTAGASPVAGGLMGTLKGVGKYAGAAAGQEATRAVAGALTPADPTAPAQPEQVAAPEVAPPTGAEPATSDASAFTPGMLQNLTAQALQAPDAKSQAAQLALVSQLVDIQGKLGKTSGAKPVAAATNQQIANATSGMQQIARLRSELEADPNLANKNAGASLFGNIGRGVAGTQSFETARNEVIDVLARLRTGAAITKQEEAQYKKMLPVLGDPPAIQKQKLDTYEAIFQGILERAKAGSPTLEGAGLAN